MKEMFGNFILVLVVTFSLVMVNCSKNVNEPNNNENETTEGIIGDWQGKNFEYANKNDPSQTANLILYGVNHSMKVNVDSTYSANTVFLSQTITETGTISTRGNQITIYPNDAVARTGTYTLSGDSLSLVIDDQEFDFNQDGSPEPATLSVELQKVK